MEVRNICVFKGEEEAIKDIASAGTVQDIITQNRTKKDGAIKKREYKTKQIIVPSGCFLRCVGQRKQADCPVSLSLRLPNGGVSWILTNQDELLSFSKWKEVKKMNLTYLRVLHGIIYIEIRWGGRITVDKDCLPEVRHLDVLSENEVIRFWESRAKQSRLEKTS